MSPSGLREAVLERDVQHDVIAAYEAVGCVVARTSPGRKGGTHQTPGIPDLYVFPPVRLGHGLIGLPRAPFWHESKAAFGKQSPAQVEWQQWCAARGVVRVGGRR